MGVLSRFTRRAFPGRNPLATTGDRLEGALLALTVVVALLAVPIVGALGSEFGSTQLARAEQERQTRQQVRAVLVADAPEAGRADPDGGSESARVPATWRAPDGTPREGHVDAAVGRKAGATVPIWVDNAGEPSRPPLTTSGAVIEAVVLAVMLWMLPVAALSVLYLVTRTLHQRVRMRRLAVEWERIAPSR